MIEDLSFLIDDVDAGLIVGASGASAATSVSVGTGPGYATAGSAADAMGRSSTFVDTGTITLVTGGNAAASRALAWGTAVGRDGNNVASSHSRASDYSNGVMRIGHTVG
jgi:hypothetical protein